MNNEILCQVRQVNEVCLQVDFHSQDSNHTSAQHINPSLCLAITACKETLLNAFPSRINDIVIAYQNMLIYFDLMQLNPQKFAIEVLQSCEKVLRDREIKTCSSNIIEIPVLYGGHHGPDLTRIAKLHAISEKKIIELHCAKTYWVYALGFIPGFAYLGFVDSKIATPRLTTPRKSVPEGSVGIADTQTGVYPSASPGGWNIIGKTPSPLLEYRDSEQLPSALLSVADQVRFKPISESEFIDLGGSLEENFLQ